MCELDVLRTYLMINIFFLPQEGSQDWTFLLTFNQLSLGGFLKENDWREKKKILYSWFFKTLRACLP